MNAFTPGPWSAELDGYSYNVNSLQVSVAFVPAGGDAESGANARLIAAAPELYAAAVAYLDSVDSDDSEREFQAEKSLRAAIAKAVQP